MRRRFLLPALLVVACLSASCALPSWRVFQKKIDPKQAETPEAQTEGQKRAAKWIALSLREISSRVEPSLREQLLEIYEVANGLSVSLGEPKHPVAVKDKEAVISDLEKGLRAKDAQLDAWKKFARTYAGKPIEDTGIDLAGPVGLLGFVGVIALCVAFPPVGYLLLRVLPVLWGYFRRSTAAIGGFIAEHPDAGEKLKAKLSSRFDAAHKRLVKVRAAPSTP